MKKNRKLNRVLHKEERALLGGERCAGVNECCFNPKREPFCVKMSTPNKTTQSCRFYYSVVISNDKSKIV